MPVMPVSVPAREISAGCCAALMELQRSLSLRRRMSRAKSITQSGFAGSKDRSRNGMAISTVQPSSTILDRAVQIVFHGLAKIGVVLDKFVDSRTKRIDNKMICVAPRVQRVEVDAHAVVGDETSVAVLGGESNLVWLTIIGINGDIEIVRIVEEPQFGALGPGLTGIGFDLIKFGDGHRLLPDRIG